MPDIFFMFVVLLLIFVFGGALFLLKMVENITDIGKKAILAGALAYVIRGFKK